MGRAKKVLDEKQKHDTERLINEGKNVREIYEVLRTEHNLDMGENTLYSKITKELGFSYDKKKKKWLSKKTDQTCTTKSESSSPSEENSNINDGKKPCDEPIYHQACLWDQESHDNKSNTNKIDNVPIPQPLADNTPLCGIIKKLDEIYKITYDTALKVFELEKRIDNINKKVTHIQKSNVQKKIEQYPQDFAEIFNSKSIKTSLNLNKEVKTRILKLMKERFGEKGNESKLINTALLLALFHYADQDSFNNQ